ncbi:MAG: hypothetical protein JWR69_2090 [Pedosphaera sp.]|nr:hypothetical protein [Pedosphaera sp.]
MKLKYTVLGLTLGGLLALTGGCSKSEPAPSASEVDKTIKEENAAVAKSADKAAEAAKPVLQQAADAVAKTTNVGARMAVDTAAKMVDTTAKPEAQAQGLIDQTKTLVSQSNYQGAVDTLKKLSSMKLTPEQQTMVNDLKAQVQKYMADHATSEGTKAIGNLLGK